MSTQVLIGKETRILVQGITGQHGRLHTQLMMDYGSKVVAGVTPNKGGQQVAGVPVFNTVEEAMLARSPNASVVFVPPSNTLSAGLEALDAGIPLVIVITEHVPTLDTVILRETAQARKATLIGPNTIGIIRPGVSKIGIMPGLLYQSGSVGVVSRSGTLTHEVASALTLDGVGQSICIGIGGDAVIGLDFIGALEFFRSDPDTQVVVLIGEIGGKAEENAAEWIASGYPKPVIAFLAGWSAPPDQRMGHAGAIIQEGEGTVLAKARALRTSGVPVAEDIDELVRLINESIRDFSTTPLSNPITNKEKNQ